jgi:hypothetical protein
MMPAAAATPVMALGELMGALAPAELAARPVADMSLDSRRIVPGALFLAVPGTREHGLRHAAAAARAGAALVAWEPADGVDAPQLPEGCAAFAVPGLRGRLGALADRFFGEPSRRLAGHRHHRHERQDHLHAPGRRRARRPRPARRPDRHAGQRAGGAPGSFRAHHPGRGRGAPPPRQPRGPGHPRGRHGGVLACAGQGRVDGVRSPSRPLPT